MKKLYIFLLTISLLISCNSASADIWSDIKGVITDPIKLGEASRNARHAVERAAIHAERIQGELDSGIRDYIKEIESIVDGAASEADQAIDKVDSIIENTLASISQLEQNFMADASKLAKCTIAVTTYQVQTSLAESLNDLGKRKPRIEIFGWTIAEAKMEASDIVSPIDGFKEAHELLKLRLSNLKASDHPSKITDTYAEIIRLSELTRCHYREDTNTHQRLYMGELEYVRKDRVWRGRTLDL